jgi:hypothetical protein
MYIRACPSLQEGQTLYNSLRGFTIDPILGWFCCCEPLRIKSLSTCYTFLNLQEVYLRSNVHAANSSDFSISLALYIQSCCLATIPPRETRALLVAYAAARHV